MGEIEIKNLAAAAGAKLPAKAVFEVSEKGKALLPSKTLTKKELEKFRERVMREYTPEALVTLMEGLIARIRLGDTQAMQLMAKVVKVVEEAPMVAMQINNSVNAGGRKPGRRFEDMVAGPQEERMRLVGGGKTTVIDTTAE